MVASPLIYVSTPKATRSSLGRVFIYTLFVNDPEHPEKNAPYFVGTTSQLSKRLSNHAQVNWHHNVFHAPPKVEIYGTCDIDEALGAVRDLTNLFREQGFTLDSSNGSWHKKEKSILTNYFSSIPDKAVVPEEWFSQWGIKTGGKKKPSSEAEQYSSMKYNVTAEDIKTYLIQTLKGRDLDLYISLLDSYKDDQTAILMEFSDYRWEQLNKHPKRNKIFAYPPRDQASGRKMLPIQKSVLDKIAKTQ